MHLRMQVAIIAFAVSTISIYTPTLMSSQPALAISKCEDDKGKSHSWYSGCRDGWYEWDVCGIYASAEPQLVNIIVATKLDGKRDKHIIPLVDPLTVSNHLIFPLPEVNNRLE